VRFAERTFRTIGAVIAALAVLSACSGSEEGGAKDRNDAPIGWSTCNALFGADRIDALQDEMGKGTLSVLNQTFPVDKLVSGSASVVQSWEPGEVGHVAYTASHPCALGLDGTGKRFESYVRWSRFSLKDVTSREGWESASDGLHVLRENSGLHLTALFPCKIKGSHQDQEAGLPLEVETEVRNLPDFDTKLLSEMTAQFARKLAKKLPCTNAPDIPSAL
jgi:hypothetical protein